MSAQSAAQVLSGLKGFQRDTVAHVIDRFFGAGAKSGSGRFLVADETGLGKSVVARGVIAESIERLQRVDPHDPVNIVYICSNLDLAQQNLKRLDVTGSPNRAITTRLSLLALQSDVLGDIQYPGEAETEDNSTSAPTGGVRLIAFTPGTSFSDSGQRQGAALERALVVILLEELAPPTPEEAEATLVMFRGSVGSTLRLRTHYIEPMRQQLASGIDPGISQTFTRLVTEPGWLHRFVELRERLVGQTVLEGENWHEAQEIMAATRQALAKAGVEALKPDLVILDEFQRFRQLLDDPEGSPAAELAHELFGANSCKVLLLSATPYKSFTYADDGGDDHYRDFLAVVRFLAGGVPEAEERVRESLGRYRHELVTGGDAVAAALAVRESLLPLMTRAERPELPGGKSLVLDRELEVSAPAEKELAAWVELERLARLVDSRSNLELWKSVPYLANFIDGYELGRATQRAHEGPNAAKVARQLNRIPALTADHVAPHHPLDPGNGRLRALLNETIGAGWWKLLWVPPSMPYTRPTGAYRDMHQAGVTKQVLFSSWGAVPTAVAGIISHEAYRRRIGAGWHAGAGVDHERTQLDFKISRNGRPQSMSTLALFWPHPELARAGDILAHARSAEGRLTARQAEAATRHTLGGGERARQAWEAFFARPGASPAGMQQAVVDSLFDGLGFDRKASVRAHLQEARAAQATAGEYGAATDHPMLARLATFSPGSIAYRALASIAGPKVSEAELWRAAFRLSMGLRTLFNRTESTLLLSTLERENRRTERPYWRQVLDYSADGNLQSLIDEYVFQLLSEYGGVQATPDILDKIATQVTEALGLRRAKYAAKEANESRGEIPLLSRFALRYGDAIHNTSEEAQGQRQANVRAAFNSPFAPFVLTTTSAGQEGIDFHWWSHAVVHWNLPGNPVDFEQREGRVNRFAGHAIRKNVADAHWPEVLASGDPSPWWAAFDAANERENGLGDFAPWWVYPGKHHIHRVLANFPLSRDRARYETLKRALALYRLTLGQPRQEDMVGLLMERGADGDALPMIDLRAPERSQRSEA